MPGSLRASLASGSLALSVSLSPCFLQQCLEVADTAPSSVPASPHYLPPLSKPPSQLLIMRYLKTWCQRLKHQFVFGCHRPLTNHLDLGLPGPCPKLTCTMTSISSHVWRAGLTACLRIAGHIGEARLNTVVLRVFTQAAKGVPITLAAGHLSNSGAAGVHRLKTFCPDTSAMRSPAVSVPLAPSWTGQDCESLPKAIQSPAWL